MEPVLNIIQGRAIIARGAARGLRERAGLTQRDVAAHCGVIESTVSRWEKGERQPRGRKGRNYLMLLVALEGEEESVA
jgi:DNA-binding transcriptional regulator YiaG